MLKQYLFNLFVSGSCALNTVLGGNPKEALSERSGRAARYHGSFWLASLINAIFFWERDHCEASLQEEKTKQLWNWNS